MAENLILAPLVLSAASVTGLVLSDFAHYRAGRYLCKPLAAAAFIWLALALGATHSGYGMWLLAGLVSCALGDLLLMPDQRRSFVAGLAAFLCGHLLYALAFLQVGTNLDAALLGSPAALILLVCTLRWLLPHLDAGMKLPVLAYIAVITAMLVTAFTTLGHGAGTLIIAGAWGFALSDIAVARQQFVRPGRINGIWGTPLYFGSQMLLASSVALT